MAHLPEGHSRAELLRRAVGLVLALAGCGRLGDAAARAAAGPPGPTLVSRDEPLGAGRALLERERTLPPTEAPRFHLVGLHWQGPGEVWLRTRDLAGAWSEWRRAVVHELPDPAEGGLRGWRLGTPVWTGGSDAVQYRLAGSVTRLRAHFVWSPSRPARLLASAVTPSITLREGWGADESIVRAEPSYAERLVLAVVHHTAGSSPATPDDSAAIVRAIQVYHVKSNGWNDIGYNFLLDPFGQVFEGRGGGVDRNVIGAHALGFNTGSTGMALLGNFEKKELTGEARSALVSLLAWRLDVGHLDPLAQVAFVSGGRPHQLRAVSGHRDVNSTECPGGKLYPELDSIAADAAGTGLPKLYDPRVETASADSVRFTAGLSEPRTWSVSVSDSSGAAVETGSGSGALIDWLWNAADAPAGKYGYTIEAGDGVRPATGSFRLGDEPPTQIPPPPARPSSVPLRIPHWAWELRAWHLTPKAKRGPRPASAPKQAPHWYWEWRKWLEARARWQKQYGS